MCFVSVSDIKLKNTTLDKCHIRSNTVHVQDVPKHRAPSHKKLVYFYRLTNVNETFTLLDSKVYSKTLKTHSF